MSTPRLDINLDKISHNARMLVDGAESNRC